MSRGQALRWPDAHRDATELVGRLADACERIEIAGSVRRRKAEVHDIELVAIPRRETRGGLWGDAEEVDLLAERVRILRDEGILRLRDVEVRRADGTSEVSRRDGASYKALEYVRLPVDLFITDAERWGCIFALRTGPGDWNTRIVTEVWEHNRRVKGGRVLHLGRPVPTPEEADFFREVGQAWLEPWDRRVDRVRIDPALWRAG